MRGGDASTGTMFSWVELENGSFKFTSQRVV